MGNADRLIDILKRARADAGDASPEVLEENLCRLIRAAVVPPEVPESLQQRVRDQIQMIRNPPPGRRVSGSRFSWRRRARWAFLVAPVTAALVFCTLAWPKWVAAQAVQRIDRAITDTQSAYEATWRLAPDGSRLLVRQLWYQEGYWRLDDARLRRIQIFHDGKLWSYDPQTVTLVVRQSEGFLGYTPSGFSFEARLRDISEARLRDISRLRSRMHTIRVLGGARVGGRPVRQVAIHRSDSPDSREVLLVDDATDLPLRSDWQRLKDGRWVTEMVTKHQFNRRLPSRLFETSFPEARRVIDWDAGQRFWHRRLAQGIARRRVGDRTIVIRDVQICSAGDVFLLYTAGGHPGDARRDWSIELTDERGTEYRNGGSFQPYMEGNRAPSGPGYLFEGEKLEGDWWIPVSPRSGRKPKRLTVTFRVAPITQDGDRGATPPQETEFTERADFTLTVNRPTPTLLPEYTPYMAVAPDEREVRRAHALTRAWTYKYGDPAQRDLRRALAAYREVIRLDEERARQSGGVTVDPQTWMEIGDLLRQLGRRDEARTAFQRAAREAPPPLRPRIQRELDALQ